MTTQPFGVTKDGTTYADPGYQKDGKPRYPLDSAEHVRSAWSYINHSADSSKYSPSQLAILRHRIMLAAKHYGVDVQAEEKARLDRLQAYYLIPTQRTDQLLDEASGKVTEANESMVVVEEKGDWVKIAQADGTPVKEVNHTGVMVAFILPPTMAEELAVEGGEAVDELHLTLCFLGDLGDVAPDLDTLERLRAVIAGFAHTCAPVNGEVSGVGLFTAGDGPGVTYASPDIPELPELRQRLVETLQEAGFPPVTNHGYTPHITLAYDNILASARVPNMPFTFDTITLAAGGNRFGYLMDAPSDNDGDETVGADPTSEEAALKHQPPPEHVAEMTVIKENKKKSESMQSHPFLRAKHVTSGGKPACLMCGGPMPAEEMCSAPEETTTASDVNTTARFMIADAIPRLDLDHQAVIPTKAFVTEVGPRTILTGPASVIQQAFEQSVTPNRHFMWMAGRFVGADEPNRNGAFWAADDLEMGQATVKHGPLNWLHEGRHVIGSIADAQFVRPAYTETEDAAAADGSNVMGEMRPHIAALSVVWRYLFPDEAAVMEMASDSGKLWYSMECVSDSVKCLGCGAETAYMDYLNGVNGACQHMIQRSAARHFVNPTFLGGAVIVPPVRPGWAGADARIMSQAASLAERAYEQAGRPDMPASEWELLMAQVVALGTSA